MATSNFSFLFLAFSLLAVSAAARPCKTLFFITSTTSYHQFPTTISQNPNPNFGLREPSLTYFFTTTTTRFHDDASSFGFKRPSLRFRRSVPFIFRRSGPIFGDSVVGGGDFEDRSTVIRSDPVPVEFYSSSIRDRTKDIMKVVGALLFGVGCGALTAATMYLIWSLFWPNRFEFDDSDDDVDDGNDDVSPKKMGYVSIPTKVVDDDLKKPAAPAKEVV